MARSLSPSIVGLGRLREPGAGLWTKGRLRPQDANGDAVFDGGGRGRYEQLFRPERALSCPLHLEPEE
jgi:hypothetical protein